MEINSGDAVQHELTKIFGNALKTQQRPTQGALSGTVAVDQLMRQAQIAPVAPENLALPCKEFIGWFRQNVFAPLPRAQWNHVLARLRHASLPALRSQDQAVHGEDHRPCYHSSFMTGKAVSYTHLTLPTKRIV
eukprot:TRINITY_DN31434_c0_g1_i1.p2 TRINITY_DN31434_c0_g1~~TRINITY_DN31434_c0_g1_i1.p2  ORF type:complete len:134 (-),score=19.99 TRINITY_DN31434_c0_g1_i1:133-534(-)